MIIKRDLSEKLLEFAKGYPVLAITGPRQSGKTTLSRIIFPEKPYVSFEEPDNAEFATNDPRGFLKQYKDDIDLFVENICFELADYGIERNLVEIEVKKGKGRKKWLIFPEQWAQIPNYRLYSFINSKLKKFDNKKT